MTKRPMVKKGKKKGTKPHKAGSPPPPPTFGPSGTPPSAAGATAATTAPSASVCTGGSSCHDDEVKLVEVREVAATPGGDIELRKVVSSRYQYINLDGNVEPTRFHPEYGRRIRLKARIEWVSGDKTRSLAGHQVYWKAEPCAINRSGLTGHEIGGFDSDDSAAMRKTSPTGADGWTDPVEFFLSQYGGDIFTLSASDKPDFSGVVLPAGCYQVWRRFWYQVTEMKDESGTGSLYTLPTAVTGAFESGYLTVFIEFHEATPRNQAEHIPYLADNAARLNAAKPCFTVDALCPFKAHIMTVDFSETGSEQRSVTDYMRDPVWTSPDWYLLWRFDSGWKVSAQYWKDSKTWIDIPNSAISIITHPSQKGFKQIKIDFQTGPVTPSAATPLFIALQIKIAGPSVALGWGGGSHHLFLCTGALHDIDQSSNWNLIQRSDCVHEIGHAVGLVNLKPNAAGAQSWEDTAHSHHCIKPATSCAMFWQSSTTRLTTFHLDGGIGCHDYLRRQDFSRSVMANLWKD